MSLCDMTLGDLLEANALQHGHHPGYVVGDRTLTHQQYLSRCLKLADALYRHRARSQDRVAIVAMNCMQYLEVYGACEISGFIVATVNYRLSPGEMQSILEDAAPTVVIFEARYAANVESFRPVLATVKAYICIGSAPAWAQEYESVLASGAGSGPPIRSRPEHIAHLVYTSGTTGKPKGCMLSHAALVNKAQIHAGDMDTTTQDRVLIVMPLFHVGARGIMSCGQWRGATIYLLQSFQPLSFLQTWSAARITLAHLAPTMLQAVLEHEAVGQLDLTCLRVMCYAAAPMPLATLRRGLQLLGPVFHQSYGQTEGMISSLLRSQHRPDGTQLERSWLQSVGQPVPGARVRIVDESGNDLPPGATGEIVYRSPCMFSGYWNDSVRTLATLRDGWVHSGDIGKLDENGFLYVVDRKRDMIISGGENIASREVENALLTHPAVAEVAVVGKPDTRWGEAVHAFVVLRSGLSLTPVELTEHCQRQIASYKKPRGLTFVTELPKLPNGKIDKHALRTAVQSSLE